MDYLMSDIHGNFKAFCEILNQISFSSEHDHLYILGDVLDRGKYGIKVLNEVRSMVTKGCADLILGNHEFFAIEYLSGNLSAERWAMAGGKDTLADIERMNNNEKEELLGFLSSLPLYLKIETKKYGTTILTHCGVDSFHLSFKGETIDVAKSIEAAFYRDPYGLMCGSNLLSLREDTLNMFDSFVFIGHIPCNRVSKSHKFIRRPRFIDIDSGSGRGGKLGCFVLETENEIYV